MGKNLIQQARGKGGPTYRAPSFKYKGDVKHPSIKHKSLRGVVVDITHCPGHSSPLAKIKFENGETSLAISPEGLRVGQSVEIGESVDIKPGNTSMLKNIPEGTLVYNIESQPGDGGKFVRAGGTFARIVAHLRNSVVVQLPSKKQKNFNPECRASIGVVACGGRKDKPFVKAGNKYYYMKARNKLYPKVSGISQNAVDHPFGGSSSSIKGRPTQSPKNAPPGRKVGKLRPRRTGRKKR